MSTQPSSAQSEDSDDASLEANYERCANIEPGFFQWQQMSNEKDKKRAPGGLGYIKGIILPSYIEIVIRDCKDPY